MTDLDKVIDAIKQGDHSRLEELLAAQPGLAGSRTADGISLLQFAACHRSPETVNILKKYRQDPDFLEMVILGETEAARNLLEDNPEMANINAGDGFPPLGLAAFFGQREMVELLLERQADPNRASANAF